MSEKNKKICKKSSESSDAGNKFENEVLSVISHELLTPINAIAGWTKVLQSENLPEKTKRKAFLTIEKQIHSHTELVDKLIDYTKISADDVQLRHDPAKFSMILNRAVNETRIHAKEKDITVAVDNTLNGEVCECDEEAIYKALMNLFRNAVKFTPEGGKIEVTAKRLKHKIKIVVKDNGKGIEKEFLPHVFEKFRLADTSSTRKYRGLGLGLAISRKIIKLHKGDIKVKSKGKGKGTEFIVYLPYKHKEQSA